MRKNGPALISAPGSFYLVAIIVGIFLFTSDHAGSEVAGPLEGLSFTAEQVQRGNALYQQQCATCHGAGLSNGEFAPPLKGYDFLQHWGGRSVGPLFEVISNRMPPAAAGSLSPDDAASVLAFILQQNDNSPSSRALPNSLPLLDKIMVPAALPGPASVLGRLSSNITLPRFPVRPDPIQQLTPVTESSLIKPKDGDWLSWRRTSDDSGFSPLKKINRSNVKRLTASWAWSMPAGANEVTPLAHDGVLYVHASGDVVQALNGATGDLLWQYVRRLPKGTATVLTKAIALYGEHLFMATSDAHVVCLDARSGSVVWDVPIAGAIAGRSLNGGPIVAKGRVIIGTGGRSAGGNVIVGLDEKNGAEVWRFATLQPSTELGTDSWNGLSPAKRSGGSVWTPGSYDQKSELVFFGPSATYDTKPLRDAIPGKNNDALYTNNTVALDPVSGKLVWAYNHMPNDQWDLDWAFERQIVDIPDQHKTKRVVVTGGKSAIFDILDAKSGSYQFSLDLGLQDLVTKIDPVTGAKNWDRSRAPGDGKTKTVCPSSAGGKNWYPSSFDAHSSMLFIPLNETCTDWNPVGDDEKGLLSTQVSSAMRPRPNSDGRYGRIAAVNLSTRRPVWTVRERAPVTTGILATAGGLVFAGYLDRQFIAYDATTGTRLWETRLNDVPYSSAITYEVKGIQYVAISAGDGGPLPSTLLRFVPEIKNPVSRSSVIWVFKIPKQ